MTDTATRDVVARRILDAPPEQVWRAWSEPAEVARWWGPSGFTTPVADLDFREGGSSLLCMRAPAEFGGGEYWNTWTYRSIRPPSRIEYDLAFVQADRSPATPPPGVPALVPHVVTLVPVPGRRTEVTVTEHGYRTDEARDLSVAGLEQCLDKMAAMFPAS
ncbi:SRPBCC domain-containing protein [Blastococcus sp. SYSU D00922]